MSQGAVVLFDLVAQVLTMDADRRRPTGDVAFRGSRIVPLGSRLNHTAEKVINARHHAALPGLIHARVQETLTHGWAKDLPLNRWRAETRFPRWLASHPISRKVIALWDWIGDNRTRWDYPCAQERGSLASRSERPRVTGSCSSRRRIGIYLGAPKRPSCSELLSALHVCAHGSHLTPTHDHGMDSTL